jgi:hypothetical protein
MNERIKELVKQAGINLTPAQFSGVLEDEVDEFTLEKLAELVAEECMNIIAQNRKYASQHKWPAVELANVCLYEIDKTFGVHKDGKETVSG